ncbi:caspase-14-like isoform X3 [Lepisosteus oculatus]|uniref:caspase-14-like isoform X3 n=1 Tax=Lepisosteus oculatus TaxID=7918 RepID=UPI00371EEBE4
MAALDPWGAGFNSGPADVCVESVCSPSVCLVDSRCSSFLPKSQDKIIIPSAYRALCWTLNSKHFTDSIGLQSSNTEGCYIDKDDVYDIDGAREAFILCQKENRRGAEVDLERTRKLLSKYGFKCTEETDLLGKEIIPELTAFRDRANRRQVRCCVVVLMAHGKEDSILGTDNQPALLKEIFALFNNKECPKLQGQPKVFIIQACRGSDVDEGVMQADDLPSDFEDDGIQKYKLPTISDTFTVYPTMPGNQALRHPERGSPLFWVMEEVFEKYAPRYHLADLFMKVNQKMVQPDYTLKSSTAKVTVNVETNFTKALFLR